MTPGKVMGAQELAYGQLEARLSRASVKETTLDFPPLLQSVAA
ncbi:hypothetical protein SIAM614_00285 [Stappia aggregata IAM 12614]|uniref:Uncharacterized protein n=1 Tax=Roseibium aggregatum (strain ATCC 25650 / DSM 13394 / JCM 20685 / NBRC 16684 / NCIMB 2208 / IAM 12614 / B1) TaxID=384765 RepID=A0P403_ROSAI|nr:hypothetical protein [Roseibium aggregatum]EAV40249.1 hypothetical protein SIAM614_00285 [Stappia aggregata IAM 12614] [Roseibium aggregatum IAM 12614]